MKFIKLVILFTIISAFSYSSLAQERIHVKKKDFYVSEDGFAAAWKSVKKGNFQFYQHRPANYKRAVAYYKYALEYNSENAELNLLTAICLLRSDPKQEALKYIQKAIDLKEDVHPRAVFFLARALHMNMEF
ncbi:MAG: tetratricopeptide repeat protein [Bacteroidales bacterium]|nr:tetratricopeptide repeat protein [Bacteroidales bacterium]